MSKKETVLDLVARKAREFGLLSSQTEALKAEFAGIWGADETPAAPAAPATNTFNVQVGVEVLASSYASQRDVEAAVKQALESAAAGRNEVVSLSVAGA